MAKDKTEKTNVMRLLEQKKLRRQDIFLMTVDGSRKVFIVEKEAEGQKK